MISFRNDIKCFQKIWKNFYCSCYIGSAGIVLGSFYTIKEQEQAVVTTFGKAKAVTSAGLHFKIPIIQRVQKVDTTNKGFPLAMIWKLVIP